ncbi:MAG: O-antigen ligase family protein, partial [Patescibacteria group bacterium]
MHIQTMARWTTLIALFTIPFIPLYIASDMYFPFITGKGFAFRILVEVALAGYVLLALVDARYRPKFSWTYLLYGALVLWMVLANFLAENVHKAFWSNFERMDGFVTIVHMFVFFAVLGSVLTVDQLWRKWWLTFLAAAGLVCAYGLFQLAGMAEIHQGGARVDATFGNAAYLGVYLLFVIAIALWQAFESKGWLRNILFAFVFVSAAILFATATRGAIIGLVGATLLGSMLWAFESKKKSRVLAGGVFLGLLVLIGVFFMAKDTAFIKSDPTLARLSSISLKDGTTRFGIWNIALAGAQERPVFGWGQEGFTYVFQKYYHPSLFGQEPWFDRAHNTYLDWLIAGGIPALLLFLGLLGSAVVALYRKSVSRPERIMLVCALAAYGFQALFVFDNLFSYLGLAALLAAAHAASGVPIKKLAALPEVNRREASTVAATVVGVVAIGILWVVNVPSIVQAQK